MATRREILLGTAGIAAVAAAGVGVLKTPEAWRKILTPQQHALNTAVSESLSSPLQMLEVALRNRFHATLSAAHGNDWFDRPGIITDVFQRNQIKDAKIDLVRDNKPIEPSRIVAALPFGFWTACLGRRYEDMWRQVLSKAFQNAPKGTTRKHVNGPLTKVRLLRNRIAHHEPILRDNLPERHEQIVELTQWLSPAAAQWGRRHSRFHDVYDQRLAASFRT